MLLIEMFFNINKKWLKIIFSKENWIKLIFKYFFCLRIVNFYNISLKILYIMVGKKKIKVLVVF